MNPSTDYSKVVSRFAGIKVLVIGDMILDVFLRGSSSRLCPEAPVPVVDVNERTSYLGGAANTACNLQLLGAEVAFCTVIGNDAGGDEALEMMKNFCNPMSYVVRASDRQTIVKTRVVAGSQIVTRFDCGTTVNLDIRAASRLKSILRQVYPAVDAVIISDYGKGTLTQSILEEIDYLQREHNKFLAVDSKRLQFFKQLSPDLVKPNYEETVKLIGLNTQVADRKAQLAAIGKDLQDATGSRLVAVTLDAEGSLIFEEGRPSYHAKAHAVATPQVAGAGDTYISAFLLSYLASSDLGISAELATAAATLAIRKSTTACCTSAELRCYFSMMAKHVLTEDSLKELCETYRRAGKRIVFTNGCFDILHSGHVTYLQEAKSLGDILIVGMNTDESITRLKGNSRPVNPLSDRLLVLAGLSSVDHVTTFGDPKDDTPINLIKLVMPDVFVKGGDYVKEDLPELPLLQEIGAEVVIIPSVPNRSTTNIIKRLTHQNELIESNA